MIDLTRELAVARKAAKKAKKAPAKKPKSAGVSAAAKQYAKTLKEHLDNDGIDDGLAEIKKLAEDKALNNADLHSIASSVLGVKVSKGTRNKLIEDIQAGFIVRGREIQKEASAKATSKPWSADGPVSKTPAAAKAFSAKGFAQEVKDLTASGDMDAANALRERVAALSKDDMVAALKAINGVPPKTSLSKKALAQRLHGVIVGNAEADSKRKTINKLTSFGEPAKAEPSAPAKASKKSKAKDDLADRPAADVADEKIGVWTIHHDKTSGGVAAIYGKSVHIFTGKMAKASAVAFAKRHTEKAASGKKSTAPDEDKVKSTVGELTRLFEAKSSVAHPGYQHTRGNPHGLSETDIEKLNQQLKQHDADNKRNEEAYYAFLKTLDDPKYTKEDLQAIFEKFNGYKAPGGKSATKKQIIDKLTHRMDVLVESRAKSSAIGGRSAA